MRKKGEEKNKRKKGEQTKPKEKKETVEERKKENRSTSETIRKTMKESSDLTIGGKRTTRVINDGTSAFLPVSHAVDNIVTITKEKPLVAGVAWNESIDRLKGSIYLVSEPYGKGQVITFADDPHFRLFWRGTLPLFLNAVLYSPSFPRE